MGPSPVGSLSRTTTWVAASGPLLVTVTTKVIVSPTLGVGSLTVLVICRSACWGVSVALDVLLPVCGSNWSLWVMVATLVAGVGLATRARRVSVAGEAMPTCPTVQSPVALL